MAINWEEAPEGATHFVTAKVLGSPWRKVTEDNAYDWTDNGWRQKAITSVARYLEVNAKDLVAKPVEAVLPNGLQWPEGYDYYNPHEPQDFFFNKQELNWNGQVIKWNVGLDYWLTQQDTIFRYGKGAGAKPEKKVGWW